MTDNLKRRQPEDPNKINVNQEWELTYWADEFGVTVSRLKDAVNKVGPMVTDVIKELKSKN